ncbi:MAG TPA: CBS domain-containing protein, partial [Nitrososphaeraceae archaeon]
MTSESENVKNTAISEFMTRNVRTIKEDESVGQACKLMYHDNIGSIVILRGNFDTNESRSGSTTKNDAPVGIITERDIT